MAKKKAEKESKKEVDYVASGLDISYSMPIGITAMLASATKTSQKEVWCQISDIANICASRLVSRLEKTSSASSWTTQTFPNSNIRLRIDMDGWRPYQKWDPVTRTYVNLQDPKATFRCRVKVANTRSESFTQKQINDYITDKILLGDDEELTGLLEAEDAGANVHSDSKE